jgi:hypothetical protein
MDPISAALDALAAHLRASIDPSALPVGYPALEVREGWPEADVPLAIDQGPLLTLTPAIDEGQRHGPVVVSSEAQPDGTVLVTEKIGTVELEAQLDLWVAYADQLRAVIGLVDAALDAQTGPPGLWLLTAGGRPLNVDVLRHQRQPSAEGADRGEWRASWTLRLRTDRVRQRRGPALGAVRVDLTPS